jgi:very-short-patch-repair endonuclease
VAGTLVRLGGCATWRELRAHHSRRAIRRAVARAEVTRPARGRYAVAEVEAHRRVAHELTATLSHVSAAFAHGWKVAFPPPRAQVTVRRNRHLTAAQRARAEVHWTDLTVEERRTGVTSRLRTVLDCARVLPFAEALAVADSALRSGRVTRPDLVSAAAGLRGPGASGVRAVAGAADGRAANPFESVLRAILLDVPGLAVRPQVVIADTGLYAVVDLADVGLRLVIEADGYEEHGTRRGFTRDCRRYTELAVHGWTVLRFAWVDVMYHRDWVRWAVESVLARRRGLPVPRPPARRQAAGA